MGTHRSQNDFQPFLDSLAELGFCSLPVFTAEEIARLAQVYDTHFGQKAIEEMYASHNSNPVDQIFAVNEAIRAVVEGPLAALFPDYRYFIGHFMVKGPHHEREFALHQDWNIVDESVHKSYQVWIPLEIAYPANGGMFVVPASHRFFGNHRSGSYGIPVVPTDEAVKEVVTDIIVPPGDVLVYHNGLFHGSYPNTTAKPRVAIIVNFVQRGAPTYYFHKRADGSATDLYAIDGDVLLRHLPQLEKGIIDPSIPLRGTLPPNARDNAGIGSTDLVQAYRRFFGDVGGAQVKQLHVCTDGDLENRLNRDGYAVVDLLDGEGVALFRQEYDRHFGDIDRTPGRFTTLQHTDAATKKRMHEFIVTHVDAPLRRYFKDFVIPVSQFYTKKAFTSGDIDLHADSTLLLNHQLEPHYAIWIPLVDVDASNGTLSVVPGSHKVRGAFFGSSIGGGYHHGHMEWLKRREVPIPLRAGQAIIFDNNLLHNSTANQTAFDRICFTFRMTHEASRYYSFFSDRVHENTFDVFEETHQYYMSDQWDGDNKRPTGRYSGTLLNSITRVTLPQLEQIVGK